MGDLVDKKTLKKLQDRAPQLVKENKGAFLGAVAGYLLSEKLDESKQLQSTILGLVAGALFDKKQDKF